MTKRKKRWLATSIGTAALLLAATAAQALVPYQIDPSKLSTVMKAGWGKEGPHGLEKAAGLPGIDSVVNFTGKFHAKGVDSNGNPQTVWPYAFVGNPPEEGGTTVIRAPVVPVSIQLLDASGNNLYVGGINMYRDATQYVEPVLQSPIFEESLLPGSRRPTQFNDAYLRAQFWEQAEDGWHTLLKPVTRPGQVVKLPYGSYYFGTNTDGTLLFVLVDINYFNTILFPPTTPDYTTVMGALEVSGQINTKDITTLLFPDTYLYFNGDPTQCCVLGFHSIDTEAGTTANGNVPREYVMNYSSWISPGLFGPTFTDITALSHEMSETFDDPFVVFDNVHNATPWWLAPNGNCQNNLEVGDVIEGLANATLPVTMPNGFTYHPQNVAMLQWFTTKPTSNGFGGAYSFPDPTVLPTAAVSQTVNCTAPLP